MNMITSTLRRATVAALSVGCIAFASQAAAMALTSTSTEYMGYYVPGEPASEADEAGYINILTGMSTSTTQTLSSRDYFRSANTLCFAICPTAVSTGAQKDETGGGTGDFGTGWTYLIGKYDGPNGGSMVWYVDGLTGMFDIPLNGPEDLKFDLSHYTLFNPSANGNGNGGGGGNGNGNGGGGGNGNGNGVPEPGTLALVGLALFGVAAARRRQRK